MISTIQPVVLFVVLSSVLVHGTTIPLFKLGKRIKSRTISITSQNNQVRMLPMLQFGQQVDLRRLNTEGSGVESGATTVGDPVQDEDGDSPGTQNYRKLPLYTGPSAEANGYSSPSEVTIEVTPQDSDQDVETTVPAREPVHADDSSNQNLSPSSIHSTLTPVLVTPSPTPSSSNAIRIFEEPNRRALAVAVAISAQQERERVKEREQSERNENSVRSLRSLFGLGGLAGTSRNKSKDAEGAKNVEENEPSLQSLKGLSKFNNGLRGSAEISEEAEAPRSVRGLFFGSTASPREHQAAGSYAEGKKVVVEGAQGTGPDADVYMEEQV